MRIFDNVTESSTVSFDVPVFEGYDAETGDLRAISEAAQDMVGVYEAMHGYAMAELGVEQGTVTLEGLGDKAKNVFDRIIASLKKLWGKIRNFFQNVIAAFNAKIKKGKDFAKMYKDKVNKLGKAEVYPYTGLGKNPTKGLFTKASSFIMGQVDHSNSDDSEFTARKSSIIEGLRGSLVGTSRLSAEEFDEKVKAYMRGADTKSEFEMNKDIVFSILENTEALKAAESAKTEMDKSFDTAIKRIEQDKKDAEAKIKQIEDNNANGLYGGQKKPHNEIINRAKHESALFTEAQSICTTFFNIWKAVWAEREKEYKAIVVRAMKARN